MQQWFANWHWELALMFRRIDDVIEARRSVDLSQRGGVGLLLLHACFAKVVIRRAAAATTQPQQ